MFISFFFFHILFSRATIHLFPSKCLFRNYFRACIPELIRVLYSKLMKRHSGLSSICSSAPTTTSRSTTSRTHWYLQVLPQQLYTYACIQNTSTENCTLQREKRLDNLFIGSCLYASELTCILRSIEKRVCCSKLRLFYASLTKPFLSTSVLVHCKGKKEEKSTVFLALSELKAFSN